MDPLKQYKKRRGLFCIMGVLGEAGFCSWMLSHVGMRARDGKLNGMVGSYLTKAFNETKDI